MSKTQLVKEARALWRRLDSLYEKRPSSRIKELKYRAWRRWMRRVDLLFDANGIGYADKLPPIFGRRSWRDPEL